MNVTINTRSVEKLEQIFLQIFFVTDSSLKE